MKLRYLHLQNLPPLHDVEINFKHESLLGRNLAIRFVVGVNGTGKTRLLQALVEVFLSLERQDLPPFPVTIAYDIGIGNDQRTIYFHSPKSGSKSEAILVEFAEILPEETDWAVMADVDWESNTGYPVRNFFRGNELPGTGAIVAFLPQLLFVYTSGQTSSWQVLFEPKPTDLEELLPIESEKEDLAAERPVGWDAAKERIYLAQSGQIEQAQDIQIPSPGELEMFFSSSRRAIFIESEQLKLAVCAITLSQAIQNSNQSLQDLLDEIGWESLLNITLRIKFQPDTLDRENTQKIYLLYQLATNVTREPESGEIRHLTFDLQCPISEELKEKVPDWGSLNLAIEALFKILGEEENPTAYDVFHTLYVWQREDLLHNLTLVFRKQKVDDILLYDWLSDGEQMFLGRIALFHLLQEQDNALLILDEPDTHFNDAWKRRMVDIIDDAMRNNTSEVVISTHSSIALTDVFDTEITLMRKNPEDDMIAVVRTPIHTFGASPSEIMRDVFGTEDTVGQRATEFLDMVLMMAAYPDRLHDVWSLDGNVVTIQNSKSFQELKESLSDGYGNDEQLIKVLQSIRTYTQQVTDKREVSVIDVLEALQDRLGPGYYQFEFRRRLRALEERNQDASSD